MLALHDPVGAPGEGQYASVVLTEDDKQLKIARERARVASDKVGQQISTRIEPLRAFWPAEDYHQKHYLRSDRALNAWFKRMFAGDEVALRDSTSAMRVNGYLSGSGTKARLAGEIASLGLGEDELEHLESLVHDTPSGTRCALP